MICTSEDAKNWSSISILHGNTTKQSGWHSLAHGMVEGEQTAIEIATSQVFK
jgi:hypothetical protein